MSENTDIQNVAPKSSTNVLSTPSDTGITVRKTRHKNATKGMVTTTTSITPTSKAVFEGHYQDGILDNPPSRLLATTMLPLSHSKCDNYRGVSSFNGPDLTNKFFDPIHENSDVVAQAFDPRLAVAIPQSQGEGDSTPLANPQSSTVDTRSRDISGSQGNMEKITHQPALHREEPRPSNPTRRLTASTVSSCSNPNEIGQVVSTPLLSKKQNAIQAFTNIPQTLHHLPHLHPHPPLPPLPLHTFPHFPPLAHNLTNDFGSFIYAIPNFTNSSNPPIQSNMPVPWPFGSTSYQQASMLPENPLRNARNQSGSQYPTCKCACSPIEFNLEGSKTVATGSMPTHLDHESHLAFPSIPNAAGFPRQMQGGTENSPQMNHLVSPPSTFVDTTKPSSCLVSTHSLESAETTKHLGSDLEQQIISQSSTQLHEAEKEPYPLYTNQNGDRRSPTSSANNTAVTQLLVSSQGSNTCKASFILSFLLLRSQFYQAFAFPSCNDGTRACQLDNCPRCLRLPPLRYPSGFFDKK